MKIIKYSIIVPVYNAERYLKECIQSVLNQEEKSWELILINDGSKDSSVNILNEYSAVPNIKIVNQENKGVSAARNKGIEHSMGEYLLFLDADDKLVDNALNIIDGCIINKPDLAIFNYFNLIEDDLNLNRDINQTGLYTSIEEINNILEFSFKQPRWKSENWYGNYRPVWGKCFRTQLIKENNIKFKIGLKVGEDMTFVLDSILKSRSILLTNNAFYIFRINEFSTMSNLKWEGSEQGNLYYYTAIEKAGNIVSEEAKRDLWLETAERDWELLIEDKKVDLKEKRKVLLNLFRTKHYQYYSKTKLPNEGIKVLLYRVFIQYKLPLSLLILVRMRKNRIRNR